MYSVPYLQSAYEQREVLRASVFERPPSPKRWQVAAYSPVKLSRRVSAHTHCAGSCGIIHASVAQASAGSRRLALAQSQRALPMGMPLPVVDEQRPLHSSRVLLETLQEMHREGERAVAEAAYDEEAAASYWLNTVLRQREEGRKASGLRAQAARHSAARSRSMLPQGSSPTSWPEALGRESTSELAGTYRRAGTQVWVSQRPFPGSPLAY
jgi:hypothetical protein